MRNLKINTVEISPGMLGISMLETTATSDFTMVLGSFMNENQAATEDISLVQTEEINSPLEKLLVLMNEEETDLKLPSDDQRSDDFDINIMLMEQFPELEMTFSQIVSWLEQKIDFQLSEDQQNNVLIMSKNIFQALNELEPADWLVIPQEPIFTMIKLEKSLQSLSKQLPLSPKDMGQLIELETLVQSLKEKVQQLSNTELFKEAIPKAFNKVNEQIIQQPMLLKGQSYNSTRNHIDLSQPVQLNLNNEVPQELVGSLDSMRNVGKDQLDLQKPLEQQPAFRGFVRELSNIMGRANFNQIAHTAKLTIRLYPEELGSLRVELLQKDGMMTAKFLASSSTAKEMLEVQMHSLRQAFSQQNIQVDRIEVTYGDSSQLKYTNQNGQHEQGRENRQEFQEQDKQPDSESSFQETMNQFIFEKEV